MKRCGQACLPMQVQLKVAVAVNRVVVACQDKPGRARMVVRVDASIAAMAAVAVATVAMGQQRRSPYNSSSSPASVERLKCRSPDVGNNARPETASSATATAR